MSIVTSLMRCVSWTLFLLCSFLPSMSASAQVSMDQAVVLEGSSQGYLCLAGGLGYLDGTSQCKGKGLGMDVTLPVVLKNMLEKKLKACGLLNQLILINFKIQSIFSTPRSCSVGMFQAFCDPTAVPNTPRVCQETDSGMWDF